MLINDFEMNTEHGSASVINGTLTLTPALSGPDGVQALRVALGKLGVYVPRSAPHKAANRNQFIGLSNVFDWLHGDVTTRKNLSSARAMLLAMFVSNPWAIWREQSICAVVVAKAVLKPSGGFFLAFNVAPVSRIEIK